MLIDGIDAMMYNISDHKHDIDYKSQRYRHIIILNFTISRLTTIDIIYIKGQIVVLT